MSEDEEGQEHDVPLQDLRPFYRSQPRQKLTFVPARHFSEDAAANSSTNRVSESYLNIVLKGKSKSDRNIGSKTNRNPDGEEKTDLEEPVCPVCNLPLNSSITEPHDASLAHQVCLTHSHPPSHLDRNHIGLRYLSSHGWDPDSRQGLGADGGGIRAPIKAVEKKNTGGLGLSFQKSKEPSPVRKETLDAGKVRKQYTQDRRRDARLREMFYGDDKLAKYLGEENSKNLG